MIASIDAPCGVFGGGRITYSNVVPNSLGHIEVFRGEIPSVIGECIVIIEIFGWPGIFSEIDIAI